MNEPIQPKRSGLYAMKLAGWGNYPRVECHVITIRSEEEARQAVRLHPALIARGNGRAYGDAALNQGATLSMLSMDRLLDFDTERGILECEAGVLLADVLKMVVPKGWFPFVTPGTKYVTIGGMIAADVHGKNHHQEGAFGAYLESFRLMGADGTVKLCSRRENPRLFAATIGGMGLTGIILSARFTLRPIETAYIRMRKQKLGSLDAVLAAFDAAADAPYSMAWIDCLAKGEKLGRGVLTTGTHAQRDALPAALKANPLHYKPRTGLSVPFFLPTGAVNRLSARLFNEIYYKLQKERETILDYDRFFYPLDAVEKWNRLYGAAGFLQYQCVIPKEQGKAMLGALLGEIAGSGHPSPLAVLKLLGPGHGPLSFPREGYTLALDFPAHGKSLALLDRLDRLVETVGGRFYLAKDARGKARTLAAGYPELSSFKDLRATDGMREKFTSLLSERLGL